MEFELEFESTVFWKWKKPGKINIVHLKITHLQRKNNLNQTFIIVFHVNLQDFLNQFLDNVIFSCFAVAGATDS